MELIDIGANLTHVSFEQDFETVVNAAQEAGIGHILLTGTDLETSTAAQSMAARDSGTFSSTAGFHPHVASDATAEAMAEIEALLQQPEVVAVGETGLDFNRNYSPPDRQKEVFEQHLQLAVERNKPLFLHQRDAHEEFFKLLSRYRQDLVGGVVHCFTDSETALQDYLELDMHIGITGWICDERRGLELQQHVRLIPDDRLLIETDAPYLLPRSLRPKPKTRRNEPKHLVEVLRVVAECRQQSMAEVAAFTTANAKHLFGLK
ncbi:MAG: TatD family hydrolase [Pseudomonadales bacterium]|nr:TatD family hydrolase [Pseudomonadales bacterium]